jgi:DNA-binding transcriptional ArsR family regulator
MTLKDRVAELERRLAVLEQVAQKQVPLDKAAADTGGGPSPAPGGDFWALNGLRGQFADVPSGGVLFTGTVGLPTKERYSWQYTRTTDDLLDEDWETSADAFSALGHPVRLLLLRQVLKGSRTAAELTRLDGMGTTGQTYHHLGQLTAAGWLEATSRGRYQVPAARVVPLLVLLSATLS